MVFLLFSICPVAEVGSCANRKHVSAILNAKTGEGVRNGMGPISQDLACYFQKIVTGCTEVCRVPFQILKLSLFWHYSVMRQATVSPEERVLVISVYKTLVNPKSTVAELKQAKQKLHSLLQKMVGSCWSVPEHSDGVSQILVAISVEKDSQRIIELVRAIGTMYYYFGAPVEFIISTREMILTNLIHVNGHVRDTVKRVISNWRLQDFDALQGHVNDVTVDFVKKLVYLIKTHTPENMTTPIEIMAPSVYKSLLLAYEELVSGSAIENYVDQHPELQVYIHYEEFIPVTNRSSQLTLLWNKYNCTADTKYQTNKLVEQAYSRMQFFLEQAPFTSAEITHVRSQLAVESSQREQEQVVEYIVFRGMEKKINPQLLGPIVREIQSIINHTYRTEKMIPFTYALLSARTTWTEEKRPGTKNWNEWMNYISAVHQQIDEFHTSRLAEQVKIWADIEERLTSLHAKDTGFEVRDYLTPFKIAMIDCCSIAHHILDWIMQSYPAFTLKSPNKLAAICYGVVIEINQGRTPYSTSELTSFGDWKSPSSILESARTVKNMLSAVVSDPTLMQTLNSLVDTEEDDSINMQFDSPLGEVTPEFIRFYVILTSHTHMSSLEHSRLQRACDSESLSGSCVVESLLPYDKYVVAVLGIHFDIAPQSVIDNIIISTNATNPFLRFHFFITNTRIPSQQSIDAYVNSFAR